MTTSIRRGNLAKSILLVCTLLWCTSVWAPPAYHPAYRPVETYRLAPERPRTEAERHINDFSSYSARPDEVPTNAVKSPWSRITDALGAPTSSIATAYLAIIVLENGHAVLTTNYKQPGKSEAPTVIVRHSDLLDSATLTAKVTELVGTNFQSGDIPAKIVLTQPIDSDEFKLIFDKDQQSFNINTSTFKTAELYLKNNSKVYSLERVDRQKPPPRWMAKLNKCCVFTGVPPDFANWDRLATMPFSKSNARVISLFPDTATAEVLKHIGDPQNIVHPDQIKSDPTAALRTAFTSGPPGSPVIIIGHVEEGFFTVEGIDGFKVSFSTVTNLAKEAGRPVFLIGCYTADHYKALAGSPAIRDYSVETTNLLYPREVAPKIVDALKSASNIQGLIEHLSDPGLYLWISNNFLRDVDGGAAKTLRAPIFKRAVDGKRSIVGFFFAYLPCKAFGACT